jgi:hypothetical protein
MLGSFPLLFHFFHGFTEVVVSLDELDSVGLMAGHLSLDMSLKLCIYCCR